MNATTLASIRRTVLFVMIGSVVVTALLAIGALLIGHFSGIQVRILLTTLALATASGLGLASGSSWPVYRTLSGSGVVLAAAAFAGAIPPLWLRGNKGWEVWIRTVGIMYVLAAALAYATLLISRRRAGERPAVTNTRLAALLALTWLTAMISLQIASKRLSDSPGFGRLMGVAIVLTVATTLVTLILQRLETPARGKVPAISVTGRTIASVERRKGETILVLDDGRRLPLAGDVTLE
ncbi:MAG: hypothetical protein ABSB96_10985 [Gaiellaceae bacterium]